MKTGMTSVTFRALSPEKIVKLVAKAGLDGIEWGGDVHVPPTDLQRAREIARMTQDSGLEVLSYGSYFTVGKGQDFRPVSEIATALGCKDIRIWLPWDQYDFSPLSEEVLKLSDLAGKAGQRISFEFHTKTANHSVERALEIMKRINRDNVRTYWQPPYWEDRLPAPESLLPLAPYVTNLHVYHWVGEQNDRRPLAEGKEAWQGFLQAFAKSNCAILEFVEKDDPQAFLRDAETLKNLIK